MADCISPNLPSSVFSSVTFSSSSSCGVSPHALEPGRAEPASACILCILQKKWLPRGFLRLFEKEKKEILLLLWSLGMLAPWNLSWDGHAWNPGAMNKEVQTKVRLSPTAWWVTSWFSQVLASWIESSSYTIHKTQLKMNWQLNSNTWNHKTEESLEENVLDVNLGNDF